MEVPQRIKSKRYSHLLLFPLLLSVFLATPVMATGPLRGVQITGGGWFVSVSMDDFGEVDHECYLGIQVLENDGVWTGHGTFMDKDFRLKAILTVTGGEPIEIDGEGENPPTVVDGAYLVDGTARLYVDNKLHGDVAFMMVLIDGDVCEMWEDGVAFMIEYNSGLYGFCNNFDIGLIGGEITVH